MGVSTPILKKKNKVRTKKMEKSAENKGNKMVNVLDFTIN